jgi:hypothetical protein
LRFKPVEKFMKSSEVRDLSDDELAVKERELRESLGILRLRFRTNQLESRHAWVRRGAISPASKRSVSSAHRAKGSRVGYARKSQGA